MKAKSVLTALLLFLAIPSIWSDDTYRENIVKIYVTVNEPDLSSPWQMEGTYSVEGSGCIISGNLILTNAHVVSDRTFITVKRAGQTKKFVARVKFIAHDCDLATLEVEDPSFFPSSAPLALGSQPEVGDTVSVIGYPSFAEQVTLTKGIVSRISYEHYVHSSALLLCTQIDAPINGGNSGGPVLDSNGSLVGIAMMAGGGNDEGFIIPVPVIQHFLTDIADGSYEGFPDILAEMTLMENPSMQKRFGLGEDQSGILLISVPDEVKKSTGLRDRDILMSIDGKQIAGDATIVYRGTERVLYMYALHAKQLGQYVDLEVYRDGKVMRKRIRLTDTAYPVKNPPFLYDLKPKYYIYGGFVFTTLNESYLRSFGSSYSWRDNAPANLYYWYFSRGVADREKEFVIIADVLSDPVNMGYEYVSNAIVTTVNGKAIGSISELIEELESDAAAFKEISTDDNDLIILETAEAKESRDRVLKNYSISSDRSEGL